MSVLSSSYAKKGTPAGLWFGNYIPGTVEDTEFRRPIDWIVR
jgi:hypothetical protein